MGFGSSIKKKFKQATGVGVGDVARGALGFGTLGGSELLFQGAGMLGFDISDPLGTQAQVDALRAAGREEQAVMLENLRFRQQIFGETAPFRERAGTASEALLAEAQAPIGEDPGFARDLKESLVQQRLAFGAFGLGDSTTFGTAAGRTTAEALSQARGRKTGILQFLAGGAETGIGGALQAQQFATQAGLTRAQTIANVGAAKAAGQQQLIQTGLDLLGTGGTLALL